MPRVSLTDRFVSGAKASGAPQIDYFDDKTPGLALRVSSGGHKAWTFIFTNGDGKRSRMTLGSYPALSLAAARTRAAEARGDVEEGADPRHASTARGAAEMTVADLVARYMADPDKARLRSIREIKRRFDRNALPVIGSIKLAQLTRRDVRDVTAPILKRGARTSAWHTHKDLFAVLRWGVANEFLSHNPAEGMDKPGGFTAGERTLTDEEIRKLWRGLPQSLAKSLASQRIVKLCLITGQRLGEICGMTRTELDLKRKLWSLPGTRTKNSFAHQVPLSDLAATVIHEALADAAGDFVFSGEDGRALQPHTVTRAVSRAHEVTKDRPAGRFGIAPWSLHDLRRTTLTNLAKLGVTPHVIANVANHRSITKSSVTFAHYVQHSYENEKRAALNLWAERLTAIVGKDAAKVLTIRRRVAPRGVGYRNPTASNCFA